MTPKKKRGSTREAQTPSGAGREHHVEEKRWVGALLALVGALMIALSAGDTLAGTGPGGGNGAPPGFSGRGYLAGSEDRNVMHGSSSGDVVVGGKGEDEVHGGPGDDFIEASGERDYVFCGPSYDIVDADVEDQVAGDCETVYRIQRIRSRLR